MTDPADQICALRFKIDGLEQRADVLKTIAKFAAQGGDPVAGALAELEVICLDDEARRNTVRLLTLVKAYPEIEATP